jgi:hypothetical protein
MMHKYALWTSHLLLLIVLTNGVRWLVTHIHGLPEFNLLLSLVVMTGLVLNHIRWWKLSKVLEGKEVLEKVGLLVMGNYSILVLLLPVLHLL